MRVGLITYALDRPRTGIGRYTLELAQALSDLPEALDLRLLHAGGPGPLAGRGIRSRRLRGCRRAPALATLGNLMVPLRARQEGLELIHDPTGVAPFGLGGGGARRVVTVHDVIPWSFPGSSSRFDSLLYRHWLPRVLPRVEGVITDSEHSRGEISRFLALPREKIWVVPLAAGAAFHPQPPARVEQVLARHGLTRGYLLFVGALDRRRNLSRLLDAYALLRRSGDPPPLVLVGPRLVSARALHHKIATLGLETHVRLAGHVPEEALPALYSGAGLFVFPSLYEGFGLPPLEAMACGAPLLCSNAASLPEVVGEAGLLVEPTSTEALCAGMQRILTDPELAATLRERGLARAAHFSWARTARETLTIYRALLSDASPRSSGHDYDNDNG